MAMPNFAFPYFSPPPPQFPKPTPSPPRRSPPPATFSPPLPSTVTPPPPPRKMSPPPTPKMAPPPLHVVPPPAPHHTVIVVFVSLGGVIFLAFLGAALCCFLKKKKKKMVQEEDMVNVSDHVHIHKTVVPGPHGEEVVAMAIDEDINVQGTMRKNEVDILEKASGIGVAREPTVCFEGRINGRSEDTPPSSCITKGLNVL